MSDNPRKQHRSSVLSPEEVELYETQLRENPADLKVRTKLLEHYMMAAFRSPEAVLSRRRHIFWVIANCPTHWVAGTAFMWIHKDQDTEGWLETKRLWAEQVTLRPRKSDILGNAGTFLLHTDIEEAGQAGTWLRKAEALAPSNATWSEHLGMLYVIQSHRHKRADGKEPAQKALACYERAYALKPAGWRTEMLLTQLARSASRAEEFGKAKEYAVRLLESVADTRQSKSWNYGNALHWSHIVLGQVALQEGDVEAAKIHLLEAGKTPGSPQLNSFGPDRVLAGDLLKEGASAEVLAYLAACSVFWKMGQEKLTQWTAAIQEGQTPDFR